MQIIFKIVLWSVFLLAAAVMAFLIRESIVRESNNIGVDPWLCLPLFIIAAFCGLVATVAQLPLRGISVACIIVGIVGVGLLFSLDHFNILIEYERWINKGMPDKPF